MSWLYHEQYYASPLQRSYLYNEVCWMVKALCYIGVQLTVQLSILALNISASLVLCSASLIHLLQLQPLTKTLEAFTEFAGTIHVAQCGLWSYQNKALNPSIHNRESLRSHGIMSTPLCIWESWSCSHRHKKKIKGFLLFTLWSSMCSNYSRMKLTKTGEDSPRRPKRDSWSPPRLRK